MSKRTQQQLESIWQAIISGKYGSDPMVVVPRRVISEPGTDIMSIPNATGTHVDVYERKGGTAWQEVPYVGQHWPEVQSALENPKFKWRTLEGLVLETGLDANTISANVAHHMDTVVRSSVSDPNGNALFTTRDHYREKSSLFERLRNSITNKVEK